MMKWVFVMALAGCVRSGSVTCGDVTCPSGTTCIAVTDPDQVICATPAQLEACAALHDHAACTIDAQAGRCYGGVCLPATCGNGRVDGPDPSVPGDTGETCDDGNQLAGDGCSADCNSNEACGNGIIDLAVGEQCDDGNNVDHDGCDSTCNPETPAWTSIDFGVPGLRTGTAMAWDAVHRQVVLFGGTDPNTGTLYGDTWVWDGTSWFEKAPAQSPKPRTRHNMAYDSTRERVVLFGGDGGLFGFDDTWEWDGETWIPQFPIVSPPARSRFGMAYDGKNHRTVLYGGLVSHAGLAPQAPDLADTWSWDGTTWTQLTTAHSPSPAAGSLSFDGRTGPAMAFDPTRGVIVLFGGQSSHRNMLATVTSLCDTHVWELDATDWHEVIPTPGPGARVDAGMAYDAVAHRLLVLDGQNNTVTPATYDGDEWEWSGTAWTSVAPGPAARSQLGIAGDVTRGAVVVFGGAASTPDAAVWEWNGTHWTTPSTLQPDVSGSFNSATFDSVRGRTIFLDLTSETFERGDTGWSFKATLPNGTIQGPRIQYDVTHTNTVLYRGYFNPGPVYVAETWLWDGMTWTNANPATQPPARTGEVLAADPLGRVVMFGGLDSATDSALDETWIWDGVTWTQAQPAHVPPARSEHALGYDPIRNVTVLFGGGDDNGAFVADTWEWDGSDWTQIPVTTLPSPRFDTPLVWQPNRARLAIVSGNSAGLADVWEWDGKTWSMVDVPPQPGGRIDHTVFPTRDGTGLIVAGGSIAFTNLADVWELRWQGRHEPDVCAPPIDNDGDGRLGCADRDCWYVCTPECPPGTSCGNSAPSCGDGTCGAVEDCRSCPADCGACTPKCGDGICDPGETCPGDCP